MAFAHGLVVLAFAYAHGYISGTHINPAVTFGLAVAGAIDWVEAVLYRVAQATGGIIAGAALAVLPSGLENNRLGATVLANGVSPLRGLILGAILTFFLVNTALHTAVAGKGGELAGVAHACDPDGRPADGRLAQPGAAAAGVYRYLKAG